MSYLFITESKPCDGCPFAKKCPLFHASTEFQLDMKRRWADFVPCNQPENAEVWKAHKARKFELEKESLALDLATNVVFSKDPQDLN